MEKEKTRSRRRTQTIRKQKMDEKRRTKTNVFEYLHLLLQRTGNIHAILIYINLVEKVNTKTAEPHRQTYKIRELTRKETQTEHTYTQGQDVDI